MAAVQFNPIHGKTEANRERMIRLITEAAAKGARLIVFPEMAISGYVWDDREEIAPYVETIPGPTTEALLPVTKSYGCYVVIGLPEVDTVTGAYYNSAVLLGPDGIVGTYQKTHLFAADPRWAREGNDGFPVFHTPIGNIALLICMDAMYFEPSRIAALGEADVIAFPTNWVGSGNNDPSKTWCLRAKENGVYWIAANRSDTERGAQFTGGSAIINQDGSVQESQVSGEGIVYGTIWINKSKSGCSLPKRRPEAYQELLLHPYLWNEGETYAIGDAAPFEVVVLPLDSRGTVTEITNRLRRSIEEVEPLVRTPNRLYVLPEIQVNPVSSDDIDKIFDALRRLAAISKGYLAFSLPEGDSPMNDSMYVIGPEGIVGSYRQVHQAEAYCEPGGSRFRTFKLPFGRLGLLTEKDAEFPEAYRILAKQGADIIAVSGTGEHCSGVWMKRIWAFENDAVLACAMPKGVSGSMLFLHRQVSLEGTKSDVPIVEAFYPERMAVARSRPFMRRMKTHLYDPLVRKDK